MKIRKIKWNAHPILGNLELDLVNPQTNEPYSTIVIAGENGTGKTTILDTVYEFLNQGPITPFDFVEYDIDGVFYKAMPIPDESIPSFFNILNMQDNTTTQIRVNRNNNPASIQTNQSDPRHYGCAYTRARANYETQPIRSTTITSLDDDIYKETEKENATSLKQLIVNVYTQDALVLAQQAKVNPQQGILWEQFEPQSKMYRFTSAFNRFFENKLTYDRVENIGDVHDVIFKKNNNDISIDTLSTGESQIVFRGAYLLKNVEKLNGSIIFVDEPEISMHPIWQEKILSFYKGLFSSAGRQNAQLFLATHSEGVVIEALRDTNQTKVIVLRSDQHGVITSGNIQTPLVLRNISSTEINYQAFAIASTDYHNALYGFIESEGWKASYDAQQPQVNYIKLRKDNTTEPPKTVSLSEKIRHIIHHPENTHNSYNESELRQSIEAMRAFILAQP